MNTLREQINESVKVIRSATNTHPSIGIILGTGLGTLKEIINSEINIPYQEIPHFPDDSLHGGELIVGELAGKKVLALSGRFHYYEGFSMQQVTFPVRVAKALGVKILIVSNAAGGMNPLFKAGDLMIITDHINLMGDNPLIGPNDDTLGPRFPDMSEPYSQELIALAENTAIDLKIPIKKGVYVGVAGPCLETRAEYRFLRAIGADAVGMSTVPEVIVAVHSGLKVLGFSAITDECFPDALQPANIEHIIATAQKIEPLLRTLVKEIISKIPE
ncbi:MAG TPA: purine-nucleoside phosphorylase [Candidatus Hydrogenedens sp.]|nr:purine-nucleoside phosphorylase [Candidatus Hydrogenedens sp.]HOK08842.1 purine-nucleoside phosphorylase [Candidatus Hydrogenedens sp.]HOL18672.1 purine-nucleoside phosphorylase [Candidatus Hydrogenedens sp.]HPP58531.1 purine-nucleoside phosphorylase [Candidatus Hydrogenedens sp.]